MRWARTIVMAALTVAGLPAWSQESGSVFAGHELATRWCSSCHVVDPGQQRQGTDAVPTFTAIAAMKSTTMASLQVFLATPHGKMPDFKLTRDDITNVSAYILSLRK